MKQISCKYCETSAPEGADVQEAVANAMADNFHELQAWQDHRPVSEVYYLCDICYYANVEFVDPNNWKLPATPPQVAADEQEQKPTPIQEPSMETNQYELNAPTTFKPDQPYEQRTLFEMLPERERPARRISDLGPLACSDRELLAVLVGGKYQLEIAEAMIARYGSFHRINRMAAETLAEEIKNLTLATAIKVKAALAVAHRMFSTNAAEQVSDPGINSPADAANMVMYEMMALDKEQLWVIELDRRNRVQCITRLYSGSVSSSQVRIAEVFQHAIKIGASAIIPAHNHPSGDPTPSPDDVAITRAMVQAGKIMDIDVLDHVVIGQGRWVSLKERGLGFS